MFLFLLIFLFNFRIEPVVLMQLNEKKRVRRKNSQCIIANSELLWWIFFLLLLSFFMFLSLIVFFLVSCKSKLTLENISKWKTILKLHFVYVLCVVYGIAAAATIKWVGYVCFFASATCLRSFMCNILTGLTSRFGAFCVMRAWKKKKPCLHSSKCRVEWKIVDLPRAREAATTK